MASLGPGIVTGAADDDPAGITTYSQAGAAFQYGLLWTALLQVPLMIGVQYVCARIGLVSGRDLGRVLRDHYPGWVLWGVTLLLAVANTVTAGADLSAVGVALQMIIGAPPRIGVPVLGLALILVLVFASYRLIEDGLKWLTLALFAYCISGILAHPHWKDVLTQTIVPGIQPTFQYLSLFVSVFGTTISPYLFIWQSGEEVDDEKLRDKAAHRQRRLPRKIVLRDARRDTIVGMTFSQVIGWFIIIAAGATLYQTGHRDIGTPNQAAQALAPLGGRIATILFSLGIIGTGLIAIPTLVGATAYGVAGLARKPAGMAESPAHSKVFSGTVAAGIAIATGFASSGSSPVGMLLLSALINGILAGPMLLVVLLVANNPTIMADRRNGWVLNALVALAAVIMGGASLWLGVWWLIAGR